MTRVSSEGNCSNALTQVGKTNACGYASYSVQNLVFGRRNGHDSSTGSLEMPDLSWSGWTISCTTLKPWETIVCWYLQENHSRVWNNGPLFGLPAAIAQPRFACCGAVDGLPVRLRFAQFATRLCARCVLTRPGFSTLLCWEESAEQFSGECGSTIHVPAEDAILFGSVGGPVDKQHEPAPETFPVLSAQ